MSNANYLTKRYNILLILSYNNNNNNNNNNKITIYKEETGDVL